MKVYRDLKEKYTFLELCKNPELACEVTLQPLDVLGVDAAIIFADIVSSLLYLAKQIQSSLVVEENKILLISGNRTNELFFSDIIN